ncbi:MAG TPA: sigma-70 family RNA polymerase sigma factor [Bacteroidales bacterium]|nr:sigma-70 family RNA polymerase sigma factor [Bacteroidales bacterium]
MTEQKGRNSDEEIIRGIREHNREILKDVYRQMFPLVQSLVKGDGGSHADAWDVFQETLGVIYDRIASDAEKFTLDSSFSTFFYAICKRIWHKQLRWRKTNSRFLSAEHKDVMQSHDYVMEEQIRENIKFLLIQRNMEKLNPACRELLEATAMGLKAEQITGLAKLGSAQAVYNKRRKCIEKLFNLIKQDPDYFILKEYGKP